MAQWFVERAGQIEGPFSTEMIQNRLQAGTFNPDDRVWGRAMEEWRTLSWWSMSLNELATYQRSVANPEVWHYAHDGSTYGPLAWNDMLSNLKGLRATSMDQLVNVMVWTKGMKEWASVLEFHEILESLGVNKRDTPRAAITGKAIIKALGNTFVSPLRHVGEGGCGCDAIPGLTPGETVTIELQSDALKASVHAKAQVRYVTDRLVGLKFTQLNVENKGLIVQYVRRSVEAQKAAA